MLSRFKKHFQHYKGDLLLFTSNLMTPAIGMIGGLVTARFVLPKELGVVQTVMLILAYLNYLHFGVINGLNRNIAFYLGREEHNKVQAIVDAAQLVTRWVATVGLVISLFVLGLFYFRHSPWLYLASTACVFGPLTFGQAELYLSTVYRGTRAFSLLGIRLFYKNLFNLLLALLPAFIGVLGVIIRNATLPFIGFLLLFRKVPVKARSKGCLSEAVELGKVGFPMLISNILYSFMSIADRSVIALFLGPEAVGHYALSGLVITAVGIIPGSLGLLLYPRAALIYGKNGSSRALRRFYWMSLGFNVVMIMPLCLAIFFTIDPVTRMLLPNYVNGIEAARINTLGSLFLIYVGTGIIIPTVRRNLPFQIAIALATAVVWGLGGILVHRGYGIEGVAWARFTANGLVCLFTLTYSYYLTAVDIQGES